MANDNEDEHMYDIIFTCNDVFLAGAKIFLLNKNAALVKIRPSKHAFIGHKNTTDNKNIKRTRPYRKMTRLLYINVEG